MINNFYKLFKDETSGLSQKINDDDIDDVGGHDKVSKDFAEKTDHLLAYIEKTYLADGFADSEEGRKLISKMTKAKINGTHDTKDEKKVMEYGFDAIFTKEDWKGFSCLFLSLEYKI